MKIEIKGEGVGDILGPICAAAPHRSGEIMQLFLGYKKGVSLEVKPIRQGRSRSQEGYYRKWCGSFADHCGLTPDEMHEEMLCVAFGSEEVPTRFGVMRRPLSRSGETNSSTYSRLIDVLIDTAADIGFKVPPSRKGEL